MYTPADRPLQKCSFCSCPQIQSWTQGHTAHCKNVMCIIIWWVHCIESNQQFSMFLMWRVTGHPNSFTSQSFKLVRLRSRERISALYRELRQVTVNCRTIMPYVFKHQPSHQRGRLTESVRSSFSLPLNPAPLCSSASSDVLGVLTAAASSVEDGGVGLWLDLAGVAFLGRDLKANFFFGRSWSCVVATCACSWLICWMNHKHTHW